MVTEVRPDLDTLERGLWCETCALPAAVSVEFIRVTLTSDGVESERLGRAAWCYGHDGPIPVPEL